MPPHLGPMTRSLPFARPSRASAFGRIPFAASRAAQVPRGGEDGAPCLVFQRSTAEDAAEHAAPAAPAVEFAWVVEFLGVLQVELHQDADAVCAAAAAADGVDTVGVAGH